MTHSLIALTGPLKGQTFELRGETTVGRHASSRLRIPDIAVSRHHCVLRPREDGWQLTDLNSRDGTFVNGRPVRQAALAEGDFVLVCGSTFLFSGGPAQGTSDDAPSDPSGTELDDETALRVAVEDSVYLHPERLLAERRAESRTARALAALLEIGAAVGGRRSVTSLGDVLLEQVLKAVPAERAALLLLEPGAERPEVTHRLAPKSDEGAFSISRTITDKVLNDRMALAANVMRGGLADADSLKAADVVSVACLPLERGDRLLGLLYLDSRWPQVELDEEHLQLLAAIAVMAAAALEQALEVERLERENRRLQDAELGHGLVGESEPMRKVFDLITRAAPSDSTILILGESGTGKELAARAIHGSSPRAAKPFVAINCATLSETLLESELFGHEKGAFTGAVARKAGKLELAHGGTLFLDEVGELPIALQARLLRVLQERTFERVGGTRPIDADLRLIAATNRDLEEAIKAGAFRDDLYYRLNVIAVTMPPLRERAGDVALLASHFAAQHGRRVRGRPIGLTPEARSLLAAYAWPGNVRELSNAVERAVVLGQDDAIRPEDLPETLLESRPAEAAGASYHDAINRLKRRLILDAVAAADGNVTRAAERLGLHPNHLHRLITTFGLRGETG